MNKTAYLSCMLVALVLASDAGAQQTQCDSVLASNLVDESTIVDKASARDTATYAACSMKYQEFGKSMGASAKGQYGVIGGSGSYNESNYNKWKQTNCNNSTTDSSRDAYRYSAHKTFKPDIVAAWSQCMANLAGLNCWASPSSGNTIEANIRWKSDENDLPIVSKASLRGGSVFGAPTNVLVAPNSKILKGTTKIFIDRKAPSSDVHAIINVQRGGTIAYSCSIFAPAVKDVPPGCTLHTGEVDFDGDKCVDSYRIETGKMIVKLSKNGRYVQVPSNIPAYNAELGFWLVGDFKGDGVTDLFHMVTKDAAGGRLDYSHVHFSDGNGGFHPPTMFSFRCEAKTPKCDYNTCVANPQAAHPQCDYNTSLGYWSARDIDGDGKTDLEHNPQLPDNRKHCWFSFDDGRFELKPCPSL